MMEKNKRNEISTPPDTSPHSSSTRNFEREARDTSQKKEREVQKPTSGEKSGIFDLLRCCCRPRRNTDKTSSSNPSETGENPHLHTYAPVFENVNMQINAGINVFGGVNTNIGNFIVQDSVINVELGRRKPSVPSGNTFHQSFVGISNSTIGNVTFGDNFSQRVVSVNGDTGGEIRLQAYSSAFNGTDFFGSNGFGDNGSFTGIHTFIGGNSFIGKNIPDGMIIDGSQSIFGSNNTFSDYNRFKSESTFGDQNSFSGQSLFERPTTFGDKNSFTGEATFGNGATFTGKVTFDKNIILNGQRLTQEMNLEDWERMFPFLKFEVAPEVVD